MPKRLSQPISRFMTDPAISSWIGVRDQERLAKGGAGAAHQDRDSRPCPHAGGSRFPARCHATRHSDLTRGDLARFSIERLEKVLNALDLEIRFQVDPPQAKGHPVYAVQYVGSF